MRYVATLSRRLPRELALSDAERAGFNPELPIGTRRRRVPGPATRLFRQPIRDGHVSRPSLTHAAGFI